MEPFWDEIDNQEIHIRDMWQLELKSEFLPHLNVKKNRYIQEFFFFVPNALQINRFTYSKQQFYEDQTNLIRYKTPLFSFEKLLDKEYRKSPLNRISTICDLTLNPENQEILVDELKLFANITRSSLRNQVKDFIAELEASTQSADILFEKMEKLFDQLKQLKKELRGVKEKCLGNWNSPLLEKYFSYIEEFIHYSINHYLSGLLEVVRLKDNQNLLPIDTLICSFLVEDEDLINKNLIDYSIDPNEEMKNEYFLYRKSLLDKFVLDALLLNTNRISLNVKYQNWIGGISAGIAMLVYIIFFIWLGTVFLINSLPFLFLTVLVYVLKDRIKEYTKDFSYKHAFKWFSDYKTEIQSQDFKHTLGVLSESFSFVDEKSISEEIREKRNKEFHVILEEYQRPESVIYYKKTILIKKPLKGREGRRHGLSIIFRFNIHRFLLKASNPFESYVALDPHNLNLINVDLPKVYHLNLIQKNTSFDENGKEEVEFKKMRLIIDKNGIKRIEQIN